MRGRRRSEAALPGVGGPSDRAAERLRAGVSRDVADLRLQLEEASLRSDAFLWAGHPGAAAEVVEEKRELVSRFEARLRQRLSEAAVEAEAERVVAAAPGAAAMSGEPRDRAVARHSPALLSALATAFLAVVAVSGPVTGAGELSSSEGATPARGEHDVAALSDEPQEDPPSSEVLRSPAAADGPTSDLDATLSTRAADDASEEPSEESSDDDGLSSVTPPLDMRDDTGDAADGGGSADEHPPEG